MRVKEERAKITADGDFSHKLKKKMLLGKKNYDKPRWHIKKQRQLFVDKLSNSQSFGFPVFMYEYESWTKKKSEKLMLLNSGAAEDS